MSVTNYNVQEIIEKFETQTDDATELSTDEELALFNKTLTKIYMDRPWAFLRRTATGNFSVSSKYLTLPTGFEYVVENAEPMARDEWGGSVNTPNKVIYSNDGTNYTPLYALVPFAERRNYAGRSGYAWVDMVNNRIELSTLPQSVTAYEYDYKYNPSELLITATGDDILLPQRFRMMIPHAMAVDDDILLRFPKEKSYAPENNAKYESYLRDMAAWNAKMVLNN